MQNQLSASELAQIITGAIVREFVNIGLVTVHTNAATVPSTPATAKTSQTAAPRNTSARVAQTRATPAATVPSSNGARGRGANLFGGKPHAKIGGEVDSRIKLPSGLFGEYSGAELVFGNGESVTVSENTEGRARMARKVACEMSGAREGQYLVFTNTHDYFWTVSVHDAPAEVSEPVAQKASPSPARKAVSVVDEFADVAPSPAKAPTAAQLAARKAFGDAAKARAAARKGAPVASPAAGKPATNPRYTVPNSIPSTARPQPRKDVGAAQKAYAVPTRKA
jgi:hypothetical protein